MQGLSEVRKNDGYFDQGLGARLISVFAGGCHWTHLDGYAFMTTLGSCVSICACDPHVGVGGMNHFILPKAHESEDEKFSQSFRYGSAAIESLLNALYKKGAAKNGLKIKVFGGANMLGNVTNDIGARNIDFMHKFFKRENLRVESEDIGGTFGRRIVFFPKTGRVLLKTLNSSKDINDILNNEKKAMHKVAVEEVESSVELF